jgi:hypothetical protein
VLASVCLACVAPWRELARGSTAPNFNVTRQVTSELSAHRPTPATPPALASAARRRSPLTFPLCRPRLLRTAAAPHVRLLRVQLSPCRKPSSPNSVADTLGAFAQPTPAVAVRASADRCTARSCPLRRASPCAKTYLATRSTQPGGDGAAHEGKAACGQHDVDVDRCGGTCACPRPSVRKGLRHQCDEPVSQPALAHLEGLWLRHGEPTQDVDVLSVRTRVRHQEVRKRHLPPWALALVHVDATIRTPGMPAAACQLAHPHSPVPEEVAGARRTEAQA